MHISGSAFGGQTSTLFNTANRKREGGKDNMKNDILKNLTAQKESIIEKRNALMAKTAENGDSLDSISEMLKIYDQQLQNIEKEIAKQAAAEAKAAAEAQKKKDEKSGTALSTPQTAEDLNNKKLNTVTDLGTKYEAAKDLNRLKSETEGDLAVNNNQLKSDAFNREEFIANVVENGGVSPMETTRSMSNKYAKVDSLTNRISELSEDMGEVLKDIQSEIQESNLQDSLKNLVNQWNNPDAVKDAATNAKDDHKTLENAEIAAKDFLDNHQQWQKDAEEKGLTGKEKDDYISDQFHTWEKNLREKSEDQFAAWKRISTSLDAFA